ncbi:uncharacterized protein JCM10292_003257 [Rhodotorula paludigena]|uniref:uncharacterized protein n=1 Tax=Rhodotorula paludigena TaxID=86838 RepID=UPI00317C37FE
MLSRVGSNKVSRPSLGPSIAQPAPRSSPSDPIPLDAPDPADVLIARLSELKRLAKSTAAYFAALAAAKENEGKALAALAQGETVRLPWVEQSLFLPVVAQQQQGQDGNGTQVGWAAVQARMRDAAVKDAESHFDLAKLATNEIVEPLKRIRIAVKSFIADLDKHVNGLAADVVKERELSVIKLKELASAVATSAVAPLTVPATSDPLIVRANAEVQMRQQVAKENELVRLTILWQNKAKQFEIEIFDKVKTCVKLWEEESLKLNLAVSQRASELGKLVDSVPSSREWDYFATLNYLLPSDTPIRNPDLVDYPERDHPSTKPVKEGMLERKKRFVKNWKEAYFVLSASGYLHEYASSTTPLSSPSISLFLPNCTVSALSPPESGTSSRFGGSKEKPALFTIEGRKSSSGSGGGTLKMKHREIGRNYRARSYAEAQEWWNEIEKFTKTSAHAGDGADRQGPAPNAVKHAGLPAYVQHEGAELSAEEGTAGGSTTDEEHEKPILNDMAADKQDGAAAQEAVKAPVVHATEDTHGQVCPFLLATWRGLTPREQQPEGDPSVPGAFLVDNSQPPSQQVVHDFGAPISDRPPSQTYTAARAASPPASSPSSSAASPVGPASVDQPALPTARDTTGQEASAKQGAPTVERAASLLVDSDTAPSGSKPAKSSAVPLSPPLSQQTQSQEEQGTVEGVPSGTAGAKKRRSSWFGFGKKK